MFSKSLSPLVSTHLILSLCTFIVSYFYLFSGIISIGIALLGLIISRSQKRQAVLALSQAEEGERRNYRIDYKLLTAENLIGTGSFGNVFRGEYLFTSQIMLSLSFFPAVLSIAIMTCVDLSDFD